MEERYVIGKRLPRIESLDKALGRAKFASDQTLPGMLFGKILRSPHAHARILAIDPSRAEKLPGVKAVITAKDTLGLKYLHAGPPFQDKLILAKDKVRYVGDEIAAVAAVNEEVAEAALGLLDVTYEVLPAVFDPEKAMEPDAPQIHGAEHNIAMHSCRKYGDVDKAFQGSDYIYEDRFVTQAVAHGCLEPHGSLAAFDSSGKLTVWTPTQSPFTIQKELAAVLGMPLSKVRVMEVYVGGGFGARSKICEDEAISALLARKSGRPVRTFLTRDEEFSTTRTRHPMIITLRTGVKKDGTLTARRVKIVVDNGAYTHMGPPVVGFAGSAAACHYRVPCAEVETYLVYTNKQFGGPFRGYGNPQAAFAVESQMDMIAERLGIDKVKIRLKNCNRSGEVTPCGWRITSSGFEACLLKAAQEIGWEERRRHPKKNRGIGFAGLIHVSGAKVYPEGDYSAACIHLFEDGAATLFTGTTDIGQGSATVLTMIAAEELGISLDRIHTITMDTDTTPADMGSWGSRVAFIGGNSVRKAAGDLKRQLFSVVSQKLECNPTDLQMRDGRIFVAGSPGRSVSVGEAILDSPDKVGKMLIGKGCYDPPSEPLNRQTGIANISSAYGFAVQAVEVAVDEETGEVCVIRVVAAHDVGRAINPMIVEGQIEGAIVQGLGYGLMEQTVCDDRGIMQNPSYLDYKMPLARDVPEIVTFIVETDDPEGPYGAKGIGEPGIVPAAPAIANAICDAVGVRITKIPIMPEEILEAL